jgi:hypothetical protein
VETCEIFARAGETLASEGAILALGIVILKQKIVIASL